MKRDKTGSCLTEKDNEEIRNMGTAEEKINAIMQRDPVLYYKISISLLSKELKLLTQFEGEKPIDVLIKESAGTLNEECDFICTNIVKCIERLRYHQDILGEDTSSTDNTIQALKDNGYGYMLTDTTKQ